MLMVWGSLHVVSCSVLGITIWSWISSWSSLPWENYFFHSQELIIPWLTILTYLELRLPTIPPWPTPQTHIHLGITTALLVQLRFRQSCSGDFMDVGSGITVRHSLTANAWSSDSYDLSTPSFVTFPGP